MRDGTRTIERPQRKVSVIGLGTQFALRWVIDQPGVSTFIPGGRNADQARATAAAVELAPVSGDHLSGVKEVYDGLVRSTFTIAGGPLRK